MQSLPLPTKLHIVHNQWPCDQYRLSVVGCYQNKLNAKVRFWKKLETKKWAERLAELNLDLTRIKQHFILYSVEWWDQSIHVLCKGCAGKRCGLNWPATKPVTAGTVYKQQEPQAMYSVSWRRLQTVRCRYVPDVTDSNILLSARGNENNDSHFPYPHYHTDRNKVTGDGAPVLRNAVCYVRI